MKFPQQISQLCLGGALSALALGGARADLLVYDPFDYDAGSPWSFQEGGQGFTTPWEEMDSGDPADLDYVRPGSLSYGNLKTSGNSILSVSPGTPGPVWRESEDAAGDPGSTTWVSFLFALETSTGSVQDFDGFALQLSTGTGFQVSTTANIGVFNSGGELRFGIADGNSIVQDLSSVALVPGETYFLTASIEWDGNGDNEVIHLYLNPTLGGGAPDPSSAIASTSALSIDTNFTQINRLQGIGLLMGDIGTEWAFDELRIGETFGDVAPVTAPEPSATVLMLGAMGVLNLRRRRRGAATSQSVRAA